MAQIFNTSYNQKKDTEIWLIGQISDVLSGTKLPSKREVMSLFFHYKEVENQTVRNASHSTANDVLQVCGQKLAFQQGEETCH